MRMRLGSPVTVGTELKAGEEKGQEGRVHGAWEAQRT